jgi:RNA polymerase sigma-70 factor (ECF subfamily)
MANDGSSGEEEEWLRRAQGGSGASFGRLVDSHQRAVRAFLRRMCGDQSEADDLAQETFLAAWTHIRRFRPGCSVRSWLYRIAYRKFLASRRSTNRRLAREAAAAEEPGALDTNLDAQLDLARAMQRLPVDQRAVIALCLGQGLSHAEAAAALDLPLGTVKSHIERGRTRLSELLGDL